MAQNSHIPLSACLASVSGDDAESDFFLLLRHARESRHFVLVCAVMTLGRHRLYTVF
jgi:hypothetical protein